VWVRGYVHVSPQCLETFLGKDVADFVSCVVKACIGQNLAWAELRLLVAGVLLAFDIEEKEGGTMPWEELRTFLLVEKRPLEMVLKERDV
jgi:hypothetical protein